MALLTIDTDPIVPLATVRKSVEVIQSPVPSHFSDDAPNLNCDVSNCALPAAVQVCADPPELLSVIVVAASVPSKCNSTFV